jgi:hypothetical protein
VFVEPFTHRRHLERKVSLGRQPHDNRSHLARQPQWPSGATHRGCRGRSGAGFGGHLRRRSDSGLVRHPSPIQAYTPSVRETSAPERLALGGPLLDDFAPVSAGLSARFSSRLLKFSAPSSDRDGTCWWQPPMCASWDPARRKRRLGVAWGETGPGRRRHYPALGSRLPGLPGLSRMVGELGAAGGGEGCR